MKYASFLAAIFAALSFGCTTTKNINSNNANIDTYIKRKINLTPSKKIENISCDRFNPDTSGKRAFLGIEVSSYEPKVIGFFYCNSVSPAQRDGVKIGDDIKKIRGCKIFNASDAISIIQETTPKSIVFMEVLRDNIMKTLIIKTIPYTPIYGISPKLPSRDISAQTCNVD